MQLKISEIQNFSFHDGPGIRTVIFLSGCPLKCKWCHNPEAQSQKNALMYQAQKCVGCRACAICPESAHTFTETGHTVKFENCVGCGQCVNVCPTGALKNSVQTLSKEQFIEIVNKQKHVYGNGGGITFSGGEPMVQGQQIIEMLDGVDVHTAIETCGYVDAQTFAKVVDRVDLVFFDLKLADEKEHIKYTGVSNKLILENLRLLRQSGKPFVLRTPLVPNVTDTEKNLSALEKIVGADKWEKLSYNVLAPVKYEYLGRRYEL